MSVFDEYEQRDFSSPNSRVTLERAGMIYNKYEMYRNKMFQSNHVLSPSTSSQYVRAGMNVIKRVQLIKPQLMEEERFGRNINGGHISAHLRCANVRSSE